MCPGCSTFPCLYGWNEDGLLVLKLCSTWCSSFSRLFCFPTSPLGLVIVFYAGGFPWISVTPYVLRFTKLLGSCASGWGLLPETFTKIILSAELFYFAHMPTGYWPGLWCFVFFVILGCDMNERIPYTLRINGSCVSVLLCVLPPPPRLFFLKQKFQIF